jgi:hypothetical protein
MIKAAALVAALALSALAPTRRTRARPLVTIRFNGNAHVLPRLVFGP